MNDFPESRGSDPPRGTAHQPTAQPSGLRRKCRVGPPSHLPRWTCAHRAGGWRSFQRKRRPLFSQPQLAPSPSLVARALGHAHGARHPGGRGPAGPLLSCPTPLALLLMKSARSLHAHRRGAPLARGPLRSMPVVLRSEHLVKVTGPHSQPTPGGPSFHFQGSGNPDSRHPPP